MFQLCLNPYYFGDGPIERIWLAVNNASRSLNPYYFGDGPIDNFT